MFGNEGIMHLESAAIVVAILLRLVKKIAFIIFPGAFQLYRLPNLLKGKAIQM